MNWDDELHLLHEFFLRAAAANPDGIAVEVPPGADRPQRLRTTYRELRRAAERIGAALADAALADAAAPERVVAVLLPRDSHLLYAAQLAILQSGGAHTCLDPSFPDDRLREILQDAEPAALLTNAAGGIRGAKLGVDKERTLCLDRLLASPRAVGHPVGPHTPDLNRKRPDPAIRPEGLAYVIYTSGTTGKPKGVMIEHRSIANLVASDLEEFRLSPSDRVAQNSSSAYDSSVEETWLAFASGATLVVMDDHAVRLGPDLPAWLRRERITVFCPPPTLLRTAGCQDPEAELPDLRLLYVGGEALPREVADAWSRGRRLVNGYGPTECTVTCLRDDVVEGRPITIGRPVRGVEAWVLNSELEALGPGELGELCVGGVALARGFWNQPELTAEKFPRHRRLGRLYRTGDLVTCDGEGKFHYQGRADSQVKLRGYRIELDEIESCLAACPGVRAAACRVQGEAEQAALVAYVVPVDPAEPPSAAGLQEAIRRSLPSYMAPARVGYISELPTTVGGKLHRAQLPELVDTASEPEGQQSLPATSLESAIEAAFADVLRRQRVSTRADFFRDLGGDSLRAALLITQLRKDPATAGVTVRDLYDAPTVAALAAEVERAGPRAAAAAERASMNERADGPHLATLPAMAVQAATLAANLFVSSAVAYLAAFHALPAAVHAMGAIAVAILAPPLVLAGLLVYAPLSVCSAAWVKRRLIGRYESGSAPVYGGLYLRNWIVQRAVGLVPWWLLEGTEFQNAALRALGARIGRRVHLHRGVDLLRGGWDLLAIGDDVTVGQDVALGLVEYRGGRIVFGAVSLGTGATLETGSHVGGGAVIEANGFLAARSSLPRGACLPTGERWDGIPARSAGTSPEPPRLPPDSRTLSPWRWGVCLVSARLALSAVLTAPLWLFAVGTVMLFGVNAEMLTTWLAAPTLNPPILLSCLAVAALPLPFLLIVEAVACRAMGRVQPGVLSRWRLAYVRVWLKAGLVDAGSRWLYGTLLWPAWLRLAGMKVGKGCEISSLIDTVPELVEIGEQSFLADGIYVGGPQIHRGVVSLAPARLGRNSFFGNGAIIAGGASLPNDVLLGVCTVADESVIRAGTSWFGHPPFELPRREVVEFDRRLTHHPSAIRYCGRLFWELLRFPLPVLYGLIVPLWCVAVAMAAASLSAAALFLVALPVLGLLARAAPAAAAVAIKWTLLGRVRPGVHPLWSCWSSRWDFVCLTWNIYAAEPASSLDGTPWLAWLLRAMGVRVGKGVVFADGFAQDLPDPDLLIFEDGATVDCLFQAHTFEDHVLKMNSITIGRNASAGRGAVLLYGAALGSGADVAPNSVVMKHECLLPGVRYEGAPVRALAPE